MCRVLFAANQIPALAARLVPAADQPFEKYAAQLRALFANIAAASKSKQVAPGTTFESLAVMMQDVISPPEPPVSSSSNLPETIESKTETTESKTESNAETELKADAPDEPDLQSLPDSASANQASVPEDGLALEETTPVVEQLPAAPISFRVANDDVAGLPESGEPIDDDESPVTESDLLAILSNQATTALLSSSSVASTSSVPTVPVDRMEPVVGGAPISFISPSMVVESGGDAAAAAVMEQPQNNYSQSLSADDKAKSGRKGLICSFS